MIDILDIIALCVLYIALGANSVAMFFHYPPKVLPYQFLPLVEYLSQFVAHKRKHENTLNDTTNEDKQGM